MEEVDNDYFPSQVDPPPPSNNNNNNNNNTTDNKGRGGAKGPSSSSSLLNATNNTSTNISSSNSSGTNSTRHHNTSALNETADSLPRSSSSAESPSPLVERSDTVVGSGAETLSPSSSLPPSSSSSAEVPSSSRSVGNADSPAPSLFPPPPPPVTTEHSSSSSSTLVDMKEEELIKVPNTITSMGVDEGCASHTEPAAGGGRCLSIVHQEGGDGAATILDSLPKDEVNVDTRNIEVPTLGADGVPSFLSTSTPTRDDPPLSFWDLVLQISQSQHAAAFTLSSKVLQSFAALGGTLQHAALALIPESLDPTEWGERLEWSPLALLFSSESTPASSQVPSWLSSEFLWNVVETHTAECVMVAVCVVLFALKCLISFRYRKYSSILSDIALQQQQRRQQDAPSSSSSGGLSDAMRGGGVQKAMRIGGLKEKRSLSLNQL